MPPKKNKFEHDLKIVLLTLAFSASLVILFSIVMFVVFKPQSFFFIFLILVLFIINLVPILVIYLFIRKLKEDEFAITTQSQQTVQSLVMERDQTASILQSIPVGIIITDLKGNINFINTKSTQILNVENTAVINLPIQKILPIEEQLGKNLDNIQTTFTNSLNKKVTLKVSAFPLIKNSQVQGTILILSDVSEQSELEALKLDFVAEAAHQLRTPLTILRSYLYSLSDKIAPTLDEESRLYMDRSKLGADQLAALVENLLNVSKVEQGELNLNLKSSYIENIIQEAVQGVSASANEKKVKITISSEGTMGHPISVDPNLISQVLVNLLMNAVENSPASSEVAIHTQKQDTNLVVTVSDHGKGIPSDATGKLFTKFYKTEGTLMQGSKGIGLGLFNSKAIIEAHKGKIWVNSIVGRGSSFGFEIPYIT